MSFDWNEYLNLAKELANEPCAPSTLSSKLRTSISRAYYSAFHSAWEYLGMIKALPKEDVGKHNYVLRWFNESERGKKYPKVQTIGSWYESILTQRINADYTPEFPDSIARLKFGLTKTNEDILKEFAIDQIITTRDILKELEFLKKHIPPKNP
jgi:uncharacterized protein (UPF0332 family)